MAPKIKSNVRYLKKGKHLASYAATGLSILSSAFSLLASLPIFFLPQIFLALNGLTYLVSLTFFLGHNLFNEKLMRKKLQSQPPSKSKELYQSKYTYLLQNSLIVISGALAGLFLLLTLVNPFFAIPASLFSVVTHLFTYRSASKFEKYYSLKTRAETDPLKKHLYRARLKEKEAATEVAAFLLMNSIILAGASILLLTMPALAIPIYVCIGISSVIYGAFIAQAFAKSIYYKYQALRLRFQIQDAEIEAKNNFSIEKNPDKTPQALPEYEPQEVKHSPPLFQGLRKRMFPPVQFEVDSSPSLR